MVEVGIQCNVHCRPGRKPPRYRAWIGDQLFTEREWIWGTDHYLQEQLHLQAEPGQYQVHYELVAGDEGKLTANNFTITYGPARVTAQGLVEI